MAYQVSTVSQYALGQLEKKLQGIFIFQTVFQNYANLFMLTKICAGVIQLLRDVKLITIQWGTADFTSQFRWITSESQWSWRILIARRIIIINW